MQSSMTLDNPFLFTVIQHCAVVCNLWTSCLPDSPTHQSQRISPRHLEYHLLIKAKVADYKYNGRQMKHVGDLIEEEH